MHEPKTFVTTDLTLAACLETNHCLFVGYAQKYNVGTWEYEQTEELETIVEDYQMDRLVVNIHRYKLAELRLRKMIQPSLKS